MAKPLSTGQVLVLEATAKSNKIASNFTSGDVVSGTAAFALEKRGYVARKAMASGQTRVTITPAGRKALKDHQAKLSAKATRASSKGKKKVAAKR